MISHPSQQSGSIKNYFVDEAGDTTIFSRRGRRVLIGKRGVSQYFILGVIDIPDVKAISIELTALRKRLISDPYFKGVPSMQPETKKTYFAFHAKDDLPEVKREVFSTLRQHPELKFLAVVKNKKTVLRYIMGRNAFDPKYRYQPNELYDYLVRRLFKNLLHRADQCKIVFARRGNSDRTTSLRHALQAAQERFRLQWNVKADAMIDVAAASLQESAGLQVADYFLWALQRCYEKGEDRFLKYIWPSIRLIQDIDDTRRNPYGEYYTQQNPLTLRVLEEQI